MDEKAGCPKRIVEAVDVVAPGFVVNCAGDSEVEVVSVREPKLESGGIAEAGNTVDVSGRLSACDSACDSACVSDCVPDDNPRASNVETKDDAVSTTVFWVDNEKTPAAVGTAGLDPNEKPGAGTPVKKEGGAGIASNNDVGANVAPNNEGAAGDTSGFDPNNGVVLVAVRSCPNTSSLVEKYQGLPNVDEDRLDSTESLTKRVQLWPNLATCSMTE